MEKSCFVTLLWSGSIAALLMEEGERRMGGEEWSVWTTYEQRSVSGRKSKWEETRVSAAVMLTVVSECVPLPLIHWFNSSSSGWLFLLLMQRELCGFPWETNVLWTGTTGPHSIRCSNKYLQMLNKKKLHNNVNFSKVLLNINNPLGCTLGLLDHWQRRCLWAEGEKKDFTIWRNYTMSFTRKYLTKSHSCTIQQ